jgi:hypothetical protein
MDDPWAPQIAGWWFLVAAAILVVYYIFLGRTILQMLRADAHTVLLVFACLALLPVPPMVVMGIVLMIIWAVHNGGVAAAPAPAEQPAARAPRGRGAGRRRAGAAETPGG